MFTLSLGRLRTGYSNTSETMEDATEKAAKHWERRLRICPTKRSSTFTPILRQVAAAPVAGSGTSRPTYGAGVGSTQTDEEGWTTVVTGEHPNGQIASSITTDPQGNTSEHTYRERDTDFDGAQYGAFVQGQPHGVAGAGRRELHRRKHNAVWSQRQWRRTGRRAEWQARVSRLRRRRKADHAGVECPERIGRHRGVPDGIR